MKILVTGGAGYIGSHTCVEVLNAGHEVVVIDDLSTGHKLALERVEELTGKQVKLHLGDICNKAFINEVFASEKVDAVIHFAAKKAVEESMNHPERYYWTNVGGTAALFEAMRNHDVRRCVFSSSAAVYGEDAAGRPVTEDEPLVPLSPYGASKRDCETMLSATAQAAKWSAVALRYFNPVGAHASGKIGEHMDGASNLMPIVLQVAAGQRGELTVNGDDYDTIDGTAVRDYIHVVDLAQAHIAALGRTDGEPGLSIYNVGTGRGHSIFEVVEAMKAASKKPVPYHIGPRRPGDISSLVADVTRSSELGWKASHTLADMAESVWNWYLNNPNGYT